MKIKTTLNLVLLSFFFLQTTIAQDFSTAQNYMKFIGEEHMKISKELWDYTRVVSRGKGAKKIEKNRMNLLQSMREAKYKIKNMPSFKGNKAYRDSTVSYLNINYNVVNKDYEKIIDMEEIAEQSYDLMEAYLLAKEVANEKLQEASERLEQQQEEFASLHNIKLIDNESKISRKLKISGKVFEYYNDVYLIFFRSFKQEFYLIDAMNRADVSSMEQNRNALLTYSETDLEKLKQFSNYQTDRSLAAICRQLLQFYNNEAKEKTPQLINFYIAKENFDQTLKSFETIKKSKRTQQDVNNYNNAVQVYNQASQNFNNTNDYLNKQRSDLLNRWNKVVQAFFNKHVP